MPERPIQNVRLLQRIARQLSPDVSSKHDEMLVAFVGVSMMIGSVGSLIAAVSAWTAGFYFGVAVPSTLTLVLLLGLLALRRGASPRVGAMVLIAGLFLTFSVETLASGGGNVGVLFVGVLVPLFAVLVLGVRVGAAVTLLTLTVVAATLAMGSAGFDFPVAVEPRAASQTKFVAAMVLPVVTFLALVLHLELRRVAQEEAEEQAEARVEAELRKEALGDEFDRLRILAGSVAHDFNNFLAVIKGNTELAALSAPAGSELADTLGAIEKSSDNAAGVVRDLLAFARRGSPDRSPLDLRDAVTDVVHLAKNAFDAALDLQIEERSDALWVSADPDGLGSALLNLIKNGVEASSDVRPRIRIEAGSIKLLAHDLEQCVIADDAEPGDHAFVSIIDAGPGIPPDQLEQIFEPFVSTKSEGRGLGLAVARGFAESHAAAIDVTSRPGRTCFRIMLPLVSVPEMAPVFVRPKGLDLEGLRVLVVDDDPGVRRVYCTMLENQRATAIEAEGGESAIAFLEGSREGVDLALIDVAMPGIGGEETFHALRALRPELPAVIMSGHAEAEFEHLGEHPGVRTLRKPFSLATLSETIRELLD